MTRTWMPIAFAAGTLLAAAQGFADTPAAIATDPPIDARAPASGQGVQFRSHGALVNAQLYRPAGAGAHPTVVLLHGLPGNEQNLDLARAMQRAGWTVLTFHYRGSWGSGGTFSLKGGIEDTDALLDQIQQPAKASIWGIDPARIVVIGHSYGGAVAAHVGATHPALSGVGLIAPWNPGEDARAWAKLTDAERLKAAGGDNNDIDGRLGPVMLADFVAQVMRDGSGLDLATLAPQLAPRNLLLVTAAHDDADDKVVTLLPALKQHNAAHMAVNELDTDHGFNDHRIALETIVLNWLAALPGTPAR